MASVVKPRTRVSKVPHKPKTSPKLNQGVPDSSPDRDETEQQLEKLIFGDEAGFLTGLRAPTAVKALNLRNDSDEEESGEGYKEGDLDDVPDDQLFFLDSGTGEAPDRIIEDDEDGSDHDKPAWFDSDDDRLTVSLASKTRLRKLRDTEADDFISGREYIRRLRRQHERLHPTPAWVEYARKRRKMARSEGSDSDSDASMEDASPTIQPLAELLRSGGKLVNIKSGPTNSKRRLRPEVIDIQRTKDVTGHGASSVDTLQFHPYYPLLLSAGPSSTVHLHYISTQSPNPNPLLTSLHMKGTPLRTASFCCPERSDAMDEDPTRIFVSARRRYFHTWSLASGNVTKISRPMYGDARAEQRTMENFKLSPCGRYMGLVGSARKGGGSINVLSTETMQWVCSCRIDSGGGVADFAWWRDGNGFAVAGQNGEVSEFDIAKGGVVMRWFDEGAVGTTVISLGGKGRDAGKLGGDRWVAVGSSSGVVNVYDRNEFDVSTTSSTRPKATRSFDQLTTPTSHLVFSSDGQMLVIASRWKRDALRLIHLPSCSVYKNWPTDKTPLGRIGSVAVSPDGMYLAVGNEQGKIRLWEIRE